MTDLLIAVGEDWIHLNLDALAESSRDLIDRSRLQAHFTKAPAYTPSTKMAQVRDEVDPRRTRAESLKLICTPGMQSLARRD